MVFVMGSVGLISSIILVATFQITKPYIEANRRAYLEQAILDVIPGATEFVLLDREDGKIVLVDSMGVLAGVAIEASGQGYQEVIRLLYGYDPKCECIVGMKVLQSKETPGLGDKIEKDARFRANFDALDVRVGDNATGGDPGTNADNSGAATGALLHPIQLAKNGSKQNAWEIEAITGATVSSRAVTAIIGGSAAELIPVIRSQIDQLRRNE
jgi:electron transport complex protein RnfG